MHTCTHTDNISCHLKTLIFILLLQATSFLIHWNGFVVAAAMTLQRVESYLSVSGLVLMYQPFLLSHFSPRKRCEVQLLCFKIAHNLMCSTNKRKLRWRVTAKCYQSRTCRDKRRRWLGGGGGGGGEGGCGGYLFQCQVCHSAFRRGKWRGERETER